MSLPLIWESDETDIIRSIINTRIDDVVVVFVRKSSAKDGRLTISVISITENVAKVLVSYRAYYSITNQKWLAGDLDGDYMRFYGDADLKKEPKVMEKLMSRIKDIAKLYHDKKIHLARPPSSSLGEIRIDALGSIVAVPPTISTTPRQAWRGEIVFDFDCTITCKHLYHCLHSPTTSKYFTDLTTHLDTSQVDEYTNNIIQKRKRGYKLKPEKLCKAGTLLDYIFGNEERIKWLRNLFKNLTERGLELHISTNGYIYDVRKAMFGVKMIQYFSLIEGRKYTKNGSKRSVFNIGTNLSEEKLNFTNKADFILHIMNKKTGKVVYVDDDPEFYLELGAKGVQCLPIGEMEQFYINEQCNLGTGNENIFNTIQRIYESA